MVTGATAAHDVGEGKRLGARESAATFAELVLHLAHREAQSRDRFTTLGSLWPLARQLAQLGVLVLVFSKLVPLGIRDCPAFVFTGLIAWTWFSAGVGTAATSVLANRHLVFQGRFPVAVLPAAAVAVSLIDVLMALPLLLALAAVHGDLHASALFFPVIVVIQLVLMCGVGWLVASANVYFRDVQNIVGLTLMLAFYITPVFYDRSRVPGSLQWILQINPMTTLIEAYRLVLLHGTLPLSFHFAVVSVASIGLGVVGYLCFERLRPGFADEL
jgi:lipopolysaccharide transport system permease protein